MSSKAPLYGVLLGFSLYAMYLILFNRLPFHVNEVGTKKLIIERIFNKLFRQHKNVAMESVLPPGISAEQACKLLRHIGRENDTSKSSLNPSVAFHWNNLHCSKFVTNDKVDEEISRASASSELSQKVPLSNVIPESEHTPAIVEDFAKECVDMLKKYDVVPGKSWGSLPVPLQK